MSKTTTIYLALGTNLGDRRANLLAALRALASHVAIRQVSSLYETEPAYVEDQPRFLNAVLRGETALPPSELLAALKQIEGELGRVAGMRFGPRQIDIDILLYGETQQADAALTIPHPRLAERPFVLVPLAEIAPELVPPGYAQSIGALAERVRGHGDILAQVGAIDSGEWA
ncbi:2-amino-4-hydroxy-6-hydroxymethyldihydropteridine diphosphokinase [Chloroflexia bacterium SDU3-3]|nr:2-amino-4-hydroxy-6-hydroxymethyldihydropteridine diphosphokinase [Chloroflexia bacterium SDU3-3]